MDKKITFFLIGWIFILGFFLRFHQLGQIPPSLNWDEASLGYNAYSILKTGGDEFGNRWPISIRSFNDYKASVYVYLSLLPLAVFGLNEFSVRFTSAFFGSLTVVLVFFLTKKINERNGVKPSVFFPCLVSFLLAISPWHLQFSRVAFEANVALFFFLAGIYLLIRGLEANFWLPLSLTLFGISMFAYHATKIVVPVFLLGLFWFYRHRLFRRKYINICSILVALCFLALLFYSFRLGGGSRFASTAGFSGGMSIENVKKIIAGYLSHYDFNFLFVEGDPQPRHHPAGLAQLYLWELPFIIAGIVFLIKNKFKYNTEYYRREKRPQYNFLIFWWFLTAPLASALTKDIPNAVRSLLFLPAFQIFTAYGLLSIYHLIKQKIFKTAFAFLIFTLCLLNFGYYLHMYYVHEPIENSQSWLYGYKEIVNYVNEHGKNYRKIIITDVYDQPYIYFLFYRQPLKLVLNDGSLFQGFENLEFRPINWEEDKKLNKVLLIAGPQEVPENEKVTREINFLDGRPAFRIVSL